VLSWLGEKWRPLSGGFDDLMGFIKIRPIYNCCVLVVYMMWCFLGALKHSMSETYIQSRGRETD
jgi:hypothetical protein